LFRCCCQLEAGGDDGGWMDWAAGCRARQGRVARSVVRDAGEAREARVVPVPGEKRVLMDARRCWARLATRAAGSVGVCKEREREGHATAWGGSGQSAIPQRESGNTLGAVALTNGREKRERGNCWRAPVESVWNPCSCEEQSLWGCSAGSLLGLWVSGTPSPSPWTKKGHNCKTGGVRGGPAWGGG
jgi:hypothetical protein